ncbi:MAG: PLP-dependent aspartate aminotransferase family protein [Defluviitaleaceae bacterium]|nr:PLP-dependent aspartate aminotransferase family protein [Defluviitaleaceae bacterium]
MNIDTACVHGFKDKFNQVGSINVPIFQTVPYKHKQIGDLTEYGYTRLHNPTREAAETLVATLENAVGSLAFTSGMAAATTLFQLFDSKDHIISTEDLYGGTITLLNKYTVEKNGVEIDFVNTGNISDIKAKIKPNTKAVFIETPTNPMMHVTDIAAVKAIMPKGALLIVDNTFLTPYFLQPLGLGADIVLHSGTKYLAGHNDTLCGFLVFKDTDLLDTIKLIRTTFGAPLAPMDSFLLIRGVKTLALRMERAQQNAMELAQWMTTHPKIKNVYYTGLPNHPGYDIMKKQASGFGAMISFEVDTAETAHKVLLGAKIITFAESLGGTETLLTYPMENTHGEVPEEERLARGINDRLLRLSVGIENIADLKSDLEQALTGIAI